MRNSFMVAGLLIVLLLGIGAGLYAAVTSTVERFTELYFVGELPQEMEMDKVYQVSYGIRNREHKLMTYRPTVSVDGNVIQTTIMRLQHLEIRQEELLVSAKQLGLVRISVQLPGKNQEIHFWSEVT